MIWAAACRLHGALLDVLRASSRILSGVDADQGGGAPRRRSPTAARSSSTARVRAQGGDPDPACSGARPPVAGAGPSDAAARASRARRRNAALELGAGRRTKEDTVDQAAGVLLLREARRHGAGGGRSRGGPCAGRRLGRLAPSKPCWRRTRSATRPRPSTGSSWTSSRSRPRKAPDTAPGSWFDSGVNRAAVDGIELEYEDSGTGEPVVFLHGAFIADAFRPLLREDVLADRRPG